ncbi:hypothetical protein V5G30_09795 [Mannheimia haemolytica]
MWGTDLFCIERKKKFGRKNNGEARKYKASPFLFGWGYAKKQNEQD